VRPGPESLGFVLAGDRAHVRATDVLAALLARFPGLPLTVKFIRPLTGPAWLHLPSPPGAAITGRAGDIGFGLTADPSAPARRRPADRAPALHLSRPSLEVFAFPPGPPLAARVAAIFDRVHPRQPERFPERFVVRQITLHPGPARAMPVVWFRLVLAPDRTRAHLTLRTPLGPLAEIDFRLTAREPPPGTARTSPPPAGSAPASSATADGDRPAR